MKDFRKPIVWEKSHQLTLQVYRATAEYPKAEQYGLTSQMRRARASIPANIAEGCGRNGDRELARFCQITMGSASELEYHLLLAHDLGYLEPPTYRPLAQQTEEVKRILAGFIKRLNTTR